MWINIGIIGVNLVLKELLTLNESESLVIPKSVRVMMLDTKCDELYTDPKFRQS